MNIESSNPILWRGDAPQATAKTGDEKRAVPQLKEELRQPIVDSVTNKLGKLTDKLVAQSDHSDKVARIKAEIAAGTFEINPTKIAEEFLWGERIAIETEFALKVI